METGKLGRTVIEKEIQKDVARLKKEIAEFMRGEYDCLFKKASMKGGICGFCRDGALSKAMESYTPGVINHYVCPYIILPLNERC